MSPSRERPHNHVVGTLPCVRLSSRPGVPFPTGPAKPPRCSDFRSVGVLLCYTCHMTKQMTCSVDGCSLLSYARTLCTRHYYRWTRYGDPTHSRATHSMLIQEKLEFYGWIVTSTGCWEWSGNRFSNGYGQLYISGRKLLTHKIAYELWVGPIPEGQVVRHFVCDNPPCINPAHLRVGTTKDNFRDKAAHGRQVYGEGVHNSKLTSTDVVEIRLSYTAGTESQRELADRFGVSSACVNKVCTRKTWARVI